jgi:type I restriction enzyme S subunit
MTNTVLLEDVAIEVTVGHVGSMADQYIDKGVPFLRSLNILPNRLDLTDVRHVSAEFHKKLKKSALLPGDVVIVRTGKPGTCAVIPKSLQVSNCSDLVIVRCGPQIRPNFLAYWVNTIASHHVASHTVGAVQQHFNVGAAKKMPIILPSLEAQDEVLSVLDALDDKIDLNRKTAATLEEMSRALYRSWFVDFDPVHAKAAGAAPAHMDTPTAALFPNRFGDDGLPEGWEVRAIGEFFKFQRGLSYKGAFLTDHGRSMINLGCFLGNGKFNEKKMKTYSGDFKPRHLVQTGDLILANTDMTQHRVVLGSPHVVGGKKTDTFLYSHHVFAARPVSESAKIWARYFYFHFLQPEFRERAEGFASGTTVLFLPADAAESQKISIPDENIYQLFLHQSKDWTDRIAYYAEENQTLETLRDTLLPRLMSGELRVCEAREQVEAVM